jgi:hypothetical protein
MPNQSIGQSSVGCDFFRDETEGEIKTSVNNVRGRNVRPRKNGQEDEEDC